MAQAQAECRFCGRKFKSAQAVRRHLGYCESYRNGSPPGDSANAPRLPHLEGAAPRGQVAEGGPARITRELVEAERARLELRRIEASHRVLDAEDRARTSRNAEERAALRRIDLESKDRQRRERRRQQITRQVMAATFDTDDAKRLYLMLPGVTEVDRARAREEVAKRLAALDIEALDERSLLAIAQNACNEVYRGAIARAREEQTRASSSLFTSVIGAIRELHQE